MTGYVFPNEGAVQWDLLITIYPFITGLVAGAFIVSSLYHVFGQKRLKPVARFSLVTALVFLLDAGGRGDVACLPRRYCQICPVERWFQENGLFRSYAGCL